jgi:hypothetical protein
MVPLQVSHSISKMICLMSVLNASPVKKHGTPKDRAKANTPLILDEHCRRFVVYFAREPARILNMANCPPPTS